MWTRGRIVNKRRVRVKSRGLEYDDLLLHSSQIYYHVKSVNVESVICWRWDVIHPWITSSWVVIIIVLKKGQHKRIVEYISNDGVLRSQSV